MTALSCPLPECAYHPWHLPGQYPLPQLLSQTIRQALYLFMEGGLFNADLSQGKWP